MPLPFIAGLALGSACVFLFSKREEVKKTLQEGMTKGKEKIEALKSSQCCHKPLEAKKEEDTENIA